MKYGLGIDKNGNLCNNCQNRLLVQGAEFCPVCGNPLTGNAIGLYEERIKEQNLKILYSLVGSTKDNATLLKIRDIINTLK